MTVYDHGQAMIPMGATECSHYWYTMEKCESSVRSMYKWMPLSQRVDVVLQTLDGLVIPAGGEETVFFDNQKGPNHYPENEFSLYRSSTNQVDVAIEVSAPGAKIATATASKEAGTGEEEDD